MTVEIEIKSQKTESLVELRKRMKDDLEPEMYDDEHLLYRFLKARDFNVDNTETMLRKHLEWRQKYDVKNILKFKKTEVLEKYAINQIIGYDKEGCVIRFSPLGNLDFAGLHASCTWDDVSKFIIFETETDTEELKKQSKKLGRNVDKCVYVYDWDKVTFAKATDKKNVYLFAYSLGMFQNNYPERLKSAIIINASLYFTFFFNMVKPFLAKTILDKIHVYTDDSFQEYLLKLVDADQLPAFLGGTRKDPDGNPLCNTFINHGELIPETYYLQKSSKSLSKSPGVKKVTLPRAAFYEVNLDVKEPNSYLEWEFETKCRDIGFGLFYQDTTDGEENNVQIIPIHRIDTEISSETGTFKCDKVGSYVLVFDNTYSWIRAKEIFYRIKVLTKKEHEAQMTTE